MAPTTTTFNMRDGELRLYDSTATPFYVSLPFVEGNLTAPIGRPRPTEILTPYLNNFAYRPAAPEGMLAALPITFTLLMEYLNWNKVRQSFGVDFAAAAAATSTWLVDGDTWLSTYGDTTIYDVDGVAIVRPTAFADSRKVCSNAECLWTSPSGTNHGFQWGEVYIDPASIQVNEQARANGLQVSGSIYGAISPITSMTAGNES